MYIHIRTVESDQARSNDACRLPCHILYSNDVSHHTIRHDWRLTGLQQPQTLELITRLSSRRNGRMKNVQLRWSVRCIISRRLAVWIIIFLNESVITNLGNIVLCLCWMFLAAAASDENVTLVTLHLIFMWGGVVIISCPLLVHWIEAFSHIRTSRFTAKVALLMIRVRYNCTSLPLGLVTCNQGSRSWLNGFSTTGDRFTQIIDANMRLRVR